MTLHPALAGLFAAWDAAGVVWALLRVPENPARPEGDIDILLEGRTARAARLVARECGFVRAPGREPDAHIVRWDRDSGIWLWLHCTTELAFGPYGAVRPGMEQRWLSERRLVGPLYVLASGHEFWVTLLHAMLDQGRFSDRSKRRLTASMSDALAEGPLAEALAPLLPPGWTPGSLLERIRGGQWADAERLVPAVRSAAMRRGRPLLPFRVSRRAGRMLEHLREIRRRRGVTVALLGPDGAGKSTLASALQESFVLPVRQVYMGLTGGWLRHVDKLRLPGVVRIGRFIVIWGRYLRGEYHAYRGRLVVFDRYIFDAEVPTPFPLGRWDRLARWLDGRTCPPPDLVLILDAPGPVMHQRKGEYTAETLEDWRGHFLRLRSRIPNVEVVDTTAPPPQVLAQATGHIWSRYERRWTQQ